MQIVGDNLHEISNPVFRGTNIIRWLSAELVQILTPLRRKLNKRIEGNIFTSVISLCPFIPMHTVILQTNSFSSPEQVAG